MMKCIFKSILCAFLIFSLGGLSIITSNGSTTMIVDDLTNGSTSLFPSSGFSSTLSNVKQMDGHSVYQSPSSSSYRYTFYTGMIPISSEMVVQVLIYVNSPLFNDPNTHYYADVFGSYPVYGPIQSLNQNAAVGG